MAERTVAQVIADGRSFVVAGHTNPDGDAVGACMALALALKKLGKDVCVALEPYNERFNVVPGRELLYSGATCALKPDTFIAVDCGSADRLGEYATLLGTAAVTVNIDHHVSNTNFAQVNHVDTASSSSSEIIFDIVTRLGVMDRDIASAIYAGIVFDTGGFRHGSTSVKTHAAASALIDAGIPFSDIYNEILLTHTAAEARAFGRALSKLMLLENGRVAYTCLDENDFLQIGATAADLNGICEYALNITGVEAAVFIYHKTGGCKVSMRSKRVRVNEIAVKLGGGGHAHAAGCDFAGAIDEARETVLRMIRPLL